MTVRILVLGSGGREHALVWKLAQSPLVNRIYVCPGNGGTASTSKTENLNLPLAAPHYQQLVQFAVQNEVSTTPIQSHLLLISAPDQSCPSWSRGTLGARHSDVFPQRSVNKHRMLVHVAHSSVQVGIPTFGPTELAARMEGSKAFSKSFMLRHKIPTATFRTFSSSQVDEAIEHVRTCGYRVVLKASGLAAGKGVLIPESTDEAVEGLRQILVANVFGAAGPLHHLRASDLTIINLLLARK